MRHVHVDEETVIQHAGHFTTLPKGTSRVEDHIAEIAVRKRGAVYVCVSEPESVDDDATAIPGRPLPPLAVTKPEHPKTKKK